jgi:hypothetical protein
MLIITVIFLIIGVFTGGIVLLLRKNNNNNMASSSNLIPLQYLGENYLVRRDGLPVFAWEIVEGKNLSILTTDEIETYIRNYNQLFESLRPDDRLQIISSYRPLSIDEVYQKYLCEATTSSELILNKFLPEQHKWLSQLAMTSTTGKIRHFLLYTVERKNQTDIEILGREIVNRSIGILGYLSRLGLSAKALKKQDIKDLLDREINPFLSNLADKTFDQTTGAPDDGNQDTGKGFLTQKEAIARDAVLVHKDHLEFGSGLYARTLFIRALPFEYVHPFVQRIFSECGYFRISQFIYGVDQQLTYSKFENQFKHSVQKNVMDTQYNARATAAESSSRTIIDQFSQGRLFFNQFNFYITLYADSLDELNATTAAFKGICADYHVCDGFMEQDRLFQSSLPCCYDHAANRFDPFKMLRREYTTSLGLANAFPFMSAKVGMRTGAVIGFDRLGEPVYFNQWARDEVENPVHVILGQMGSGKSFMQEVIEMRQSPQDVVTVIFHKSANYDFSTKLLGGEVLDFDLDSDTKLNVFDPVDPEELVSGPTPETVALITGFLNIILTDIGTAGIGSAEEGLLDVAIRDTYLKKKGQIPILGDLAETLDEAAKKYKGEQQVLCRNLRLKLDPYIGKGTYAKLTNQQSTVTIKSSRVALNLSKIPENNPKIFALSMFTAASILSKVLAANKGKSKLKVKFDETWAFLKSPAGASLIDNLVRRARHLNTAVDIVTQFPSDLMATESAKSVLQGAKCVTLLQQAPTDHELLKEIFKLNASEIEIISNMGQVKGRYSEAYMITGKRRGLVRIVPDRHTYWIATTEPQKDLPMRSAMMQKHSKDGIIDYWSVVDELAKSS